MHHERAVAIFTAAYGADHPHVGAELLNVGRVRYEQGDDEAALLAFTQGRDVLERALGAEHLHVAFASHNMGQTAARLWRRRRGARWLDIARRLLQHGHRRKRRRLDRYRLLLRRRRSGYRSPRWPHRTVISTLSKHRSLPIQAELLISCRAGRECRRGRSSSAFSPWPALSRHGRSGTGSRRPAISNPSRRPCGRNCRPGRTAGCRKE